MLVNKLDKSTTCPYNFLGTSRVPTSICSEIHINDRLTTILDMLMQQVIVYKGRTRSSVPEQWFESLDHYSCKTLKNRARKNWQE